MRRSILFAASVALAIVAVDLVVAHGAMAPIQVPTVSVNRALKGDRAPAGVPLAPAVTVVPKMKKVPEPVGRILEGCEAAVSPLAKTAEGAPPALCLADANAGVRPLA